VEETFIIPDITIPDLKLVIEFQGYQHYTNCIQVHKDTKRKQLLRANDWNILEIPYFVQLSTAVLTTCFKKYKSRNEKWCDQSNSFPHGFVHPKAILPGCFCISGIEIYKTNLEFFPNEVRQRCIETVRQRSKILKIPPRVLDPVNF